MIEKYNINPFLSEPITEYQSYTKPFKCEEYFCKERDDCLLEDNEEFINLHKHINSL